MTTIKMKEMASHDRPRERMLSVGPESLSDYELIAVLLRTGKLQESALNLAQRILKDKKGLHGLAKASVRELMAFDGLGEAKATSLIAALELGKRMNQRGAEPKNRIQHAEDVYQLVGERLRVEKQEVFEVLFLDMKNQILGAPYEVGRGSIASCPVEPALIFREGSLRNALRVILIHNHPSGDPHPSQADIQLTYRISEAGEVMGIQVLDHLIIGDSRFVSFQESGLLND